MPWGLVHAWLKLLSYALGFPFCENQGMILHVQILSSCGIGWGTEPNAKEGNIIKFSSQIDPGTSPIRSSVYPIYMHLLM